MAEAAAPATETEEKMDVDATENVKDTDADFDVIEVEEEEAPAATAGRDPVPDDVVDVPDEPKPEEKSTEPITVPDDDEGNKSQPAGRQADAKKKGGASSKPTVKPLPKLVSHHTAKSSESQVGRYHQGQVRSGQKLEAAKEQLEDAVWLDANDMAGRIPYRHVEPNGRLKEISHKLSYFLRGHALADGFASPVMDYTDLSMEWGEVREYLCTKVHNVVDWEILQVIRSSDTRRFQLQVTKPDNETATLEGYAVFACDVIRVTMRFVSDKGVSQASSRSSTPSTLTTRRPS